MNRAAVLLLLALGLTCGSCPADSTVISLDSLLPFSENFDSLGSAQQAILPVGWQLGGGANFSGVSTTKYSAGTSGTGAISSSSLGGFYNWADGVNATSTDRAPGFLIDEAFLPNKSLFVGFRNNTAGTINDLQITYDVEKYRNGASAVDINFYYAFDELNWIAVPTASVHYGTDPASTAINPPSSTSISTALTGLSIADQSNLYFRWQYAANPSSNGKGIGIDNVAISFTTPKTLIWSGPNGGTWDDATSNWKDGGSNVIWNNAHRDRAVFANPVAGVGTSVNISSPRMTGAITFDSAAGYTISGSSLTIAAGGAIQALSGSHNISAPFLLEGNATCEISAGASMQISGTLSIAPFKTFTKTGNGTLRLSGPRDFASGATFNASGGTLVLASNSQTPKPLLNIQTSGADALVVADVDQDLSELNISNEAGKQGFDLHSPGQAGAFRAIRIYSADLQEAKNALYASILSAIANPQDGIFDSALAAHQNSAIGIGIFNDHILIRPTRIGDVNLDGQVTIADFIDLSTNFNRSGTWQEGDINGDGVVTIADFIDLASNFNRSYSGAVLAGSPDDAKMLQIFAAAHGASVPEPTILFMSFFAALVIPRSRRVQSAK